MIDQNASPALPPIPDSDQIDDGVKIGIKNKREFGREIIHETTHEITQGITQGIKHGNCNNPGFYTSIKLGNNQGNRP